MKKDFAGCIQLAKKAPPKLANKINSLFSLVLLISFKCWGVWKENFFSHQILSQKKFAILLLCFKTKLVCFFFYLANFRRKNWLEKNFKWSNFFSKLKLFFQLSRKKEEKSDSMTSFPWQCLTIVLLCYTCTNQLKIELVVGIKNNKPHAIDNAVLYLGTHRHTQRHTMII